MAHFPLKIFNFYNLENLCILHGHVFVMLIIKTIFIPDIEVENINLTELSEDTLNIIEADTFWCTSKLLDGIQDNYTFAQPGIQTKVNALKELIKRIDSKYLSK